MAKQFVTSRNVVTFLNLKRKFRLYDIYNYRNVETIPSFHLVLGGALEIC